MVAGIRTGLPLGAGGVAGLRPQDVFTTSLYTGNNTAQVITTNTDVAGKGGLIWEKVRNTALSHRLVDTQRGALKPLVTDTTAAETSGNGATNFTNTGFSTSTYGAVPVVAYSILRAPKFFDIVTYTGDGTSGRQIAHNLGIKPGMIVIKRRDSTGNWPVYHRSLGATGGTDYLWLHTTDGAGADGGTLWNNTEPTASAFTLGNNAYVNAAGGTYVAYLFAHDPDTTKGFIQCGTASGGATVNLGWRPQFAIIKSTNNNSGLLDWIMLDSVRGWDGSNDTILRANLNNGEAGGPVSTPNSTGFTLNTAGGVFDAAGTYVYMAIRAPIT